MTISNDYPLKFAVLYVLAKNNRALNVEEILEQLRPVYGGEKAFNRKNVRFHLDSMVGIDMASMTNERMDENGEVTADYLITPFGQERTAMLPDEWRKDLE